MLCSQLCYCITVLCNELHSYCSTWKQNKVDYDNKVNQNQKKVRGGGVCGERSGDEGKSAWVCT